MRAIVKGKRYDTTTAVEIASISRGGSKDDYQYCEETLFLTAPGQWFLAGWGNALTKYAERVGDMLGTGWRIVPFTAEDAQSWLEEHRATDALEKYFSGVIEDA